MLSRPHRVLAPFLLALVSCSPATPGVTPPPNAPGVAQSAPSAPVAAKAPLPITLAPCTLPDLARPAKCGTAHVLEDRSLPHGRVIPLKVIVVPAKQTPALPDPVVLLAGGPGEVATDAAPWLPADPAKISETRDLVYVDQRGMAHDSPLHCAIMEPGDVGRLPNGELPEEKLKACLASIDANPALYTTSVAADDLNEVLGELGYAQANILGISYGTFAAQVLAHAHPERVRSMLLFGVAAPDSHFVLDFAPNAQAALDETFKECAADAGCRAMHPDPKGELARAFARLDAQPARLTAKGPDEKPYTVTLDRKSFSFALRELLYRAASRGKALSMIHEVAVGDDETMGSALLRTALTIGEELSIGGYLSIACTESLGGATLADVEKASAGTFLGTARALPLWSACRFWPKGAVPVWLHEPVDSDTPALLFGGTVDPATPLAGLEKARAKLKNAQAVIVEGAGHDVRGTCATSIVTSFLEHPLARVDTSCVKPIVTEFPKPPVKLTAKVLDRCVGRFEIQPKSAERPPKFIITVTRDGDQLHGQATGEPMFLLDAESPTLFRVRDLDAKIEFQMGADGKAARVIVRQGEDADAGERVP